MEIDPGIKWIGVDKLKMVNKDQTFCTHKVRVQEPGNAYYQVFPDTKIVTDGNWLKLVDRSGEVQGVWNRDAVIYATPSTSKERS